MQVLKVEDWLNLNNEELKLAELIQKSKYFENMLQKARRMPYITMKQLLHDSIFKT